MAIDPFVFPGLPAREFPDANATVFGGAAMGLQELGLSLRAADLAMANAYWNPRPLTRDSIRQLLDDAFHGTLIDA